MSTIRIVIDFDDYQPEPSGLPFHRAHTGEFRWMSLSDVKDCLSEHLEHITALMQPNDHLSIMLDVRPGPDVPPLPAVPPHESPFLGGH